MALWRKLYTQILDNQFLMHDQNAYCVFTKLWLLANDSGEYQFSTRDLAQFLRMPHSTLYKTLGRLEAEGMIETVSTPRGRSSTIKIIKFTTYQDRAQQRGKQQSKQSGKRLSKELQPVVRNDSRNDLGASGETAGKQRGNSQPQNNRGQKTSLDIDIEKEYINTTNVVLAPRYGDPKINELFDAWEEHVGYPIQAKVQANRRAAHNLLRKFGAEKLTQLIKGIAMAQGDQYAPRISDFADLQRDLNKLIAWGNRTQRAEQTQRGIVL